MIICLMISMVFNLYYKRKLEHYREYCGNKMMNELQEFADEIENGLNNENAYVKAYGDIAVAQSSLAAVGEGRGILSDEWNYSLARLLIEIKRKMVNNKEDFIREFQNSEAAELMYKISHDFEDKESIEKIFQLLGE